MGKRIVVALGGNALGNNLSEQARLVRTAARAVVDLIEDGNEVAVVHGNGPQVGLIQDAMASLTGTESRVPCPLSVCVAMSQGYIGFDLQNALREQLRDRGIGKDAVTVLTQVRFDPEDPALQRPSKPIGGFMTEAEARRLAEEEGCPIIEDAGRGWRRAAASPRPQAIVEIEAIRALVDAGHVVVACGGGGIPVFETGDGHLAGAAAVIDKDYAASVLAQQLDADLLIILTAVEKVAIHFGSPDQLWLDRLTPDSAARYIEAGEFAPGSMLPKVEAALSFVRSRPGREALITHLEKARDGIAGKTGTRIGV